MPEYEFSLPCIFRYNDRIFNTEYCVNCVKCSRIWVFSDPSSPVYRLNLRFCSYARKYGSEKIFILEYYYLESLFRIFYAKIHFPVVYLLKVNNRNTRTRCKICSKLTIKTPERHELHPSAFFNVNFEHDSHPVLVFVLLTLNM